MACFRRILSPTRFPISTSIPPSNPLPSYSRNPISGRHQLLKIWSKSLKHTPSVDARKLISMFRTQRKVLQSLNLSGRKLLTGSFLGMSTVAGMMYHQSNVVYAMGDHADFGEPSGILKDDLDSLWALLKKFRLPVVLLMTVLLGWRHPITLAINVALLLFCTKPDPSSIYIFLEQLRQIDMHQNRRLYKSKMFYVKKVEVQDFKILCFARVELRDLKRDVVGILGSWWVIRTSTA